MVDINKAKVDELTRIVHIGTIRAMAIIAGRPYKDVHELSKVRGLGKKRMEDIIKEGLVKV